MASKTIKTLTFLTNDLVFGGEVCVVGALARSYGFRKALRDNDTDEAIAALCKRTGKTKSVFERLVNLNDGKKWTKLTRRLLKHGFYNRVKKYALGVIE